MKLRSIYIIFSIFTIFPCISSGQYVKIDENFWRSFTQKGSLQFENLTVLDASEKLRDALGFALSFESEILDPDTMGITANQLKNSLEDRSGMKSFTDEDASLLKAAIAVSKETPNSIISWQLSKVSINLSNVTFLAIATSFLENYNDYKFVRYGAGIVLAPRKSELEFEIQPFSANNITLSELLLKLSPVLAEHKIVVYSLGKNDVFSRIINAVTFEEPTSAMEVLTIVAQAAGSDVYWHLGGMKGSRALTFLSKNKGNILGL